MAPRPKRRRMLKEPPASTGFIPDNGEYDPKERIVLYFEEYEALKLLDYDGLTQEEASKKMMVSRPTLTRIYRSTREKIAKAFVENKQISVQGGVVEFQAFWYRCSNCGSVFKSKKTGKGHNLKSCPVCNSEAILSVLQVDEENIFTEDRSFRRQHRMGMGSGGNCICPKCDYRLPHESGTPCNSLLCPHCEIRMVREDSPLHKMILNKRKIN